MVAVAPEGDLDRLIFGIGFGLGLVADALLCRPAVVYSSRPVVRSPGAVTVCDRCLKGELGSHPGRNEDPTGGNNDGAYSELGRVAGRKDVPGSGPSGEGTSLIRWIAYTVAGLAGLASVSGRRAGGGGYNDAVESPSSVDVLRRNVGLSSVSTGNVALSIRTLPNALNRFTLSRSVNPNPSIDALARSARSTVMSSGAPSDGAGDVEMDPLVEDGQLDAGRPEGEGDGLRWIVTLGAFTCARGILMGVGTLR